MNKRAAVLFGLCFVVVLCAAYAVLAQESAINPEVYSHLRFRYIGPVGNRTDAAAGVPGNPLIYYAGAASGGMFKSTDGGIHWDPIFDSQPVSSIGALAVAPSDANTVWAGTGESFIRSHISVGMGIYKSLDAGKTWTHMGLEKTGRIGRIVIDTHNPDIVLACALGHAYGPQQERGVFRTTDGGKNWERVLFVDENTGCSDIAMDPNNPRILLAGMWQLVIHTWGRTSGGPGSGLYKSTDEGATWKHLEGHGLPHAPLGKIGVAIARRNSSRMYALIETGDGVPMDDKPTQRGQLWSTDNGGDTWLLVSYDRQLRGRSAYYTRTEVSPDNENELYFMSAAFSRSLDGGHTLSNLPASPGGDNHDMWIDPTNSDRMIVANDAGVSITVNHGRTWDHINLPIAQIYHVTLDNQIPYFVYGNRQDGPSWRGPSNSLQFGGFFGGGGGGGPISRSLWHSIAGGESGFATPDPVDNNMIWSTGTGSGSVGGATYVFNETTRQWRNVEVWPETTVGAPAAEVKYRFNWEFPLTISPHDHNKVYVGSQFVHVTTDGGNSWHVISPDLTRNDKSRMQISGGLTPDNIGVEYAGVVFAIAESPKEAGVLWAGTNDGLVHVSRDGGKNWSDVTKNIPGLPEWGTVSNIEASRYDAGTAYITVDFHQVNNRDPFVYKTADYGKTWTLITNGIPHSMLSYAHCIREDPVRKGLLYLGTENALYVSFDDGKNWQPMQTNLPHAPVYWIAIQERFHDLVLATYGRGFWILDDITPLEQWTPQIAAANAHLFAPRDAYRFRAVVQPVSVSYDPSAGQNISYGADINYYLKAAPEGDVKLTILDSNGQTVRSLQQAPKLAGMNRIFWDLRGEQSKEVRLRTEPQYAPEITLGPEGWRPAPGVGRTSLLLPPGTYTVKLSVGGQDYTQKLNVLKDPRSGGTPGDIQAQIKLATAIRDEINRMADGVNQIEVVRAQLVDLKKQFGDDEEGKAVKSAADELDKKLLAVEAKLIQVKATGRGQDDVRWSPELLEKLDYLFGEVESSDFPPTTQQTAVQNELSKQATQIGEELRQVVDKDVAGFNAMLRQKNIPNIVTKVPEGTPSGGRRGPRP